MSPPRILIVYGTSYGQTARIAGRIRQLLVERGLDVTLLAGDRLPAGLRPAQFDGVLVGASLIMQGYQKYVAAFVRRHAAALNAMPSAFFAVSGSAGSDNPLERAAAQRLLEKFCHGAGWQPSMTASFAGTIAFTRYNFALRWFMKRISRKEGQSTDTSRDHEYTDWTQVTRFAEQFAEAVQTSAERAGHAHGALAFSESTA
ncbi:MAG TPA: flavodoxin domain-containing protein [Gemmatimonadaceae bacterium]|nr:flavodoxin domain-containing protein [Gemmatimonadaceae bacterium]